MKDAEDSDWVEEFDTIENAAKAAGKLMEFLIQSHSCMMRETEERLSKLEAEIAELRLWLKK